MDVLEQVLLDLKLQARGKHSDVYSFLPMIWLTLNSDCNMIENTPRLLSVVTGAGKHSIGGKARIKPAVKSYLKDEVNKISKCRMIT